VLHARHDAGRAAVSGITLDLRSPACTERVDGVRSFVGEDASGSFGILPGHERLLTVLSLGLARFRTVDDAWHYIAVPGAVLDFDTDRLVLATRRYLRDDDYARISRRLDEELAREEEDVRVMRESLVRMEEELLRRLSESGRSRR